GDSSRCRASATGIGLSRVERQLVRREQGRGAYRTCHPNEVCSTRSGACHHGAASVEGKMKLRLIGFRNAVISATLAASVYLPAQGAAVDFSSWNTFASGGFASSTPDSISLSVMSLEGSAAVASSPTPIAMHTGDSLVFSWSASFHPGLGGFFVQLP